MDNLRPGTLEWFTRRVRRRVLTSLSVVSRVDFKYRKICIFNSRTRHWILVRFFLRALVSTDGSYVVDLLLQFRQQHAHRVFFVHLQPRFELLEIQLQRFRAACSMRCLAIPQR